MTDRHLTGGAGGLNVLIARALEAFARFAEPGDGRQPEDVLVHLREKDLGGRDVLALARTLRGVTRAAGARLFVNDRVDVALAVGADGVHLGGGSLTPAEVQSLAPTLAVSVATHSVDEVERASAEPAVSFAVLGPVFDTPSKRRYGMPPLGLETLAAAVSRVHGLPIVAIGGITVERSGACLAAGASGVACIREILTAKDPARALASLWPSGNRKR